MRASTPLRLASAAALGIGILAAGACRDDDEDGGGDQVVGYEIPATYDAFENVSYAGQQARLAMLGEMKALMRAAVSGEPIDSARLSAMYANAEGADYTRTYEKQLRDKTLASVADDYEGYFGELAAAARAAGEVAREGQAGVARSLDGERAYLLDADGVEWAQIIEKGLMGATFYYQATGVYLAEDKMSADNEVVEPGEGTAMQHHFDEAFGYLGVPIGFPADTEGAVFWGDYAVDRDADIGAVERLGEGFLRGRAAIGADAYDDRDEAIADIRDVWEEVVASTAIHYLNGALEHADDPARRLHSLSEAVAFLYGLPFNPATQIDRGEVADLLTALAGASEFAEMNLYATTDEAIETVRADVARAYGWQDVAAEL